MTLNNKHDEKEVCTSIKHNQFIVMVYETVEQRIYIYILLTLYLRVSYLPNYYLFNLTFTKS